LPPTQFLAGAASTKLKGPMRLKTLALNPYLHMAVLTVIVAALFGRTLGSFFLADDFGEVAYVSRIAGGDLGMLWANFSGNYMQISSMSVWRPWLLISLLTDFIIWGAKPFGYYLTNLVFYLAVCLSLYWFVRSLCRDWCKTRGSLAAFFAALIFAVNPLHCESVSWVVGRVDIICAFFYLTCLNLFILSLEAENQRRKKLTILSVVSFWLAMWTKEMAIGAPVLAMAISLLWGRQALDLKKSLRLCTPLLLSTVVYFILRYLALGTLLGGYTQGIGDAQAAGALGHWLDGDSARRLFIPLAYSIYGSNHIFQTILALLYTVLGTVVLIRALSLTLPLRWLLFWPLWLVTALAPIYKLWGLGYELEGARFVFFATMPLAAFFPIMLFAPQASAATARSLAQTLYRRAVATITLIGLSGLALVYLKVAHHLNLEWVHAGKEVREFSEKAIQLAGGATEGDIIVLGIPKRRGGAHMVLNGTTFKIMLSRPFVDETLPVERLITFDPIIFGNADYINARRFKDCLARPRTRAVLWDSQKRQFTNLSPEPSTGTVPQLVLPTSVPPIFLHTMGHAQLENADGKPAISHITAGDGVAFANLNFSPLDADIAEVSLTCLEAPIDRPLTLGCCWNEQDADGQNYVNSDFLSDAPSPQKVYLRLSQNYRWFTQDKIKTIFLTLPAQTKLTIQSVRLLKASEVCPQLSLLISGAPVKSTSPIGVIPVSSSSNLQVKVSLPQALQQGNLLLEISKPNAFFENFSRADQAQMVRAIQKTTAAPESIFILPKLPAGANYQIRARVTNGDHQYGEPSDPLVLRME